MSGRNDDPRAGHPNGHLTSHPNVDPSEMPADLAAVQADDLLLDMLGSAGRPPGDVGDVDGELTRVLTAWRHEVHADSNRLLVDTDTALAVISAARRPIRRRRPVFGPVAAAAAVLVIAFSAVGLVAKSAQPGDNLWGVTEVLYSDYARSVETAASVRTELEQANKALQENKPERAKASLDRIRQQLPVIAEAEGKTDLAGQHRDLERKLDAGTPPQASRPVPPDASSSERLVPRPSDSSSSATSPSTQPDSAKPEPTRSPSPTPSTEPTPTPSTEPTPTPGAESIPESTPPTGPDDQPTQPSAKPIGSPPPPDFIPPAPPYSSPPPSPGRPEDPRSGRSTSPGVSRSPGDIDSGYGGPEKPDQPQLAGPAQLPPSSATTASA
ncbi:MAG: anti-sigma-D factor RsdA [Pseudonocardiaceae bacterium]